MRKRIVWSVVAVVLAVSISGSALSAPLRICLVSGSAEYESDVSLAGFKGFLESRYDVRCSLIKAIGFEELPGLEALDDCDVALFFTRRLTIDGEQLQKVKDYCLSGRPIVAVRTASHGFQNWLEFDKIVLGGNYHDHFGVGFTTATVVEKGAENHPVLAGVGRIKSASSLYKTDPLAADARLLMTGSTPKAGPQPVTWTREYEGGRVFYTALGAPDDFGNAAFRRLLANALFWTTGREPVEKEISGPPARPKPEEEFSLRLRGRVETSSGSGDWEETSFHRTVPVAETAILICDMWDRHWCIGAQTRCDSLAGVMAPVIAAARKAGIRIIHAPSETMDYYADRPGRVRALTTPMVSPPEPRVMPDPPLPIDDSDGGCDTPEKPWYEAWTSQNGKISVDDNDFISDQGRKIYSFLKQEGIKNLLFTGVHTNMCVLHRTFGMKQMTKWGIDCVIIRDLTDSLYDPCDPPFVSHNRGTELVVEYIEKYWGPSISSGELLEGLPAR